MSIFDRFLPKKKQPEIKNTMPREKANIKKTFGVYCNKHHHTKNEKFIVVHGHGLIQLRKLGTDEIIEFEVSGDKIEVVEMIPGYTHNIINLSETDDLVTFMWANECFDPSRPDTYFEEV